MESLRRAWVHRRDAVTLWLVVAILAAYCVPVAVAAARARHDRDEAVTTEVVPETGFGGYRWWGEVHAISATWRVPAVDALRLLDAPGSDGYAATWIGAQNRDGGYPFIQLGTNENISEGAGATYQVFWSDSSVGDHPQQLGLVQAGDLLAASMVRRPSGWSLTVEDRTTGETMHALVAYGAGAAYSQAEWLQEDPTSSTIVATDLPYAPTSTVRFSRVEVNGASPRLGLDNGQTLMATRGVNLVPSPFDGDGFSMVQPQGPAERYLVDAGGLDRALALFDVELVSWSQLPERARAIDLGRLLDAYSRFDAELEASTWPGRARTALATLARQNREVVAAYRAWESSGFALGGAAYLALDEAVGNASADPARAALGLPPA
ncbi:MAG TPA: hypothetical protein VMD59_14295 [Acidimicrobiales bacterium]|nr:hypothetical protein [Acidimicrobiales bacterium]